eukprot:jgi/Picre1/30921/NNA_006280.t1
MVEGNGGMDEAKSQDGTSPNSAECLRRTNLRAMCPDDTKEKEEVLKNARKSLASRTDGASDVLKPLDLKRALRSSAYYSGVRSFEVPFTPFPLPFKPTTGVRFLARDPFDDPENARVRYEEVFYDDDRQGKVSPLVGIDPNSKEYVRGGSRNASARIFLEERLGVHGDPPELEVPGFSEYLVSLEHSGAGMVEDDAKEIDHRDVHQEEEEAKVNVQNLFDGILPFDDSEDEGEELGSDKVEPIEEDRPVSPEKDMVSLIDKVLEGTMDLSEALPEVDKDGKLKRGESLGCEGKG